ncbi:MAG TPA: MEDS domain-containing protein [Acidobacteriaceae bacterium]|nr:MEDS domain-containing protein [Acidobacteriaceae bacterium]
MAQVSGHQCLIYEGAPSRQLSALAAVTGDRLSHHYRCMCLNSAPMIARTRSYLATAGVDVESALERGSLILSSERSHLVDGHFDLDRMLAGLETALQGALRDGYAGLWATGDMTWEMGPDRDFSKLLEYEWRLEKFIREHPEMGGICQYHVDALPRAAMRHGVLTHRSLFVNETLSLLNPHAAEIGSTAQGVIENAELDAVAACLCHASGADEPRES